MVHKAQCRLMSTIEAWTFICCCFLQAEGNVHDMHSYNKVRW